MDSRGRYYTDLAVASVLRILLLLSLLAVYAIMTGCARDGTQSTVPFTMTGSVAADYRPIAAGGETSQTRNSLPIKGTNEKSDSALIVPAK